MENIQWIKKYMNTLVFIKNSVLTLGLKGIGHFIYPFSAFSSLNDNHFILSWATQVVLMVQNILPMQEMQVMWAWSLGWEYSLEKEMATHSNILAWKIPWTEGIWQAAVHKVTKSQTWLSTHTHTHTHTALCQVGSVIPISEMREKRASESRNFRKKFGNKVPQVLWQRTNPQ